MQTGEFSKMTQYKVQQLSFKQTTSSQKTMEQKILSRINGIATSDKILWNKVNKKKCAKFM